MTNYLLNILGIVIMGVLIEIITPNGKMSKYIKSIFSIFVVFVLISPLSTISSNINITKYFDISTYQLDNNLLANINERKINAIEIDIENALADEQITNVNVDIYYELTNNEIIIQNVQVELKNAILNKRFEHINKYAFINEVLLRYVDIEERIIEYYE